MQNSQAHRRFKMQVGIPSIRDTRHEQMCYSGTSYLAAYISPRYLKMEKATWSLGETDDLDKLHSNISFRKILKPSKPQLKNIQFSKFSTLTLHFCCQKRGGCLDQWALLTYLAACHVPCWEPCVHKPS